MQDVHCGSRRLSPLSIVLPQPPLPRPRASGLATPNTPRTPSSTSQILFTSRPNRNSTDSWNSSNGPDEFEFDWKPEQIRLLSRTLDALPSHLVTPFIGPTPPSNLLDKIAYGVSQAKGPTDWPHSIRATRVKLIELSRLRAKEPQPLVSEDKVNTPHVPSGRVAKSSTKRPLYRQSSMDFINPDELKENNDIACFTDRLQDRLASANTNLYHPYSRRSSRNNTNSHRAPVSSPRPTNLSSRLSPATPSSSTLNTLSSFSAHQRILRRTSSNSNVSATSASSFMSVDSCPPGLTHVADPRIKRVLQASCPPTPPVKDANIKISSAMKKENLKDSSAVSIGMKRPPSFGTLAQEIKRQVPKDSPSYLSSDEEEKLRTLSAKKIRVKDAVGLGLPASIAPGIPAPAPVKKSKKPKTAASPAQQDSTNAKKQPPEVPEATAPTSRSKKSSAPPMNPRRNPSMFGHPLPLVSAPPEPRFDNQEVVTRSPAPASVSAHRGEASPLSPVSLSGFVDSPPSTPAQKTHKTLRRVRRIVAPGRRISFGSLAPPASGEDADGEEEADMDVDRRDRQQQQRQNQKDPMCQLGSAFQLH